MFKDLKVDDRLMAARHSAAHVMAQAVLELFPGAKLGIGPAIQDGFYYDFDLPRPLTPEDLEKIEARMREIIAADYPFERQTVTPEEARELFKDQPYKLELIDGILAGELSEDAERPAGAARELSIYRHDGFVDLCRGPHVESTGKIPADGLKLLRTSGAYWRGDASRPQLQRIYGTLWRNRKELRKYLNWLQEVEKRDHRRLGKELDLFSIRPETVGPGLVLWHPKGGLVRKLMEDFWREAHLAHGYDLVFTPHVGRSALWETSGHLDFYRENMYSPMDVEGQTYFIKPMNCPFHIQIYQSRRRSYRELPFRWAELGTVYRYERSGVLHGLLRVRGFTQDDAHLFVRPDQVEEEIRRVIEFSLYVLRTFGFEEFDIYLSTRPEKFVGEVEMWETATQALRRALEEMDLPYQVKEGEGAFYGPKIDIDIRDALGRAWQCTTIQFDFNLPERFNLTFVGEDGGLHRPYMIHRALMGSIERFFGVLLEHYAGALPVWLAPVQAVLIPITGAQNAYAHQVAERLRAAGLRVQVDDGPERMNAKIRHAQLQKVPYQLVVGEREVAAGQVNVRLRDNRRIGAVTVEAFLDVVGKIVAERAPRALWPEG